MTDFSLPVTLTVASQLVFSGDIHLGNLLKAIAHTSDGAGSSHHNSYPITPDQAEQLLRKIDQKSAAFLKAIAQNEGEIDFQTMSKIFGIKKWTEYSSGYGKGITRALRYLTDNSSAVLIWWNDDDWASDNDPQGSVYVDGQALKSLQIAIGSTDR